MATIKVPESLYSSLESLENGGSDKSNSGGDLPIFESLEASLNWLCDVADEWCKKNELTGFGELGPDKYSKLLSLAAQKHGKEWMKENSLEMTLALATAGLIGVNVMDLKERQKKIAESKKEAAADENS